MNDTMDVTPSYMLRASFLCVRCLTDMCGMPHISERQSTHRNESRHIYDGVASILAYPMNNMEWLQLVGSIKL